jgi:hypothetical protein
MWTPLRVVFDTNAFTPDHFDIIDNSPMRGLCKSGRIVPVYGHVLLEETVRVYGIEGKREQLVKRWLPLIADTVDRFCDDLETIWHRELVQGYGVKTNIWLRKEKQRTLLDECRNLAVDGSWRAWDASKHDRDIDTNKRTAQRNASNAMRREVADWRKAVGYNRRKHGVSRLDKYTRSLLDEVGRESVVALVKCKSPLAVADRWSAAKMQYPYFTTFVLNMLYMAHYAMTRPNDKIDPNAQADLDLMTHLLRADALVSNETGFLCTAFEDLWRPKGKVIFTSKQFAELMGMF